MRKNKRHILWLTVPLGVTVVLLLVVVLVLPRLINSEPLKEKIRTEFYQNTGGRLDYERVDLTFFPSPRVVIHRGEIGIAGRYTGKFGSIGLHIRVLPLFMGKFEFSKLVAEQPDIETYLPEKEQSPSAEAPITVRNISRVLTPILAAVAEADPAELTIELRNGRVRLYDDNRVVADLKNLQGAFALPRDRVLLKLSGKSNLAETISFSGSIHRETFRTEVEIALRRFTPQPIFRYLPPTLSRQLGDCRMDLNLKVEGDGKKAFRAEVMGSDLLLTLLSGKEALSVRGSEVAGSVAGDDSRIVVAVRSLNLTQPRLSMSGNFLLDSTTPNSRLEILGKEVDVEAVRQTALFVAGSDEDVQDVFNILRGGKVPSVSIVSQAGSPADLDALENVTIQGSLVEGIVFVPKAQLDLTEVQGEATISSGILTGKKLSARFGATIGQKGTLTVDLDRKEEPFHLDIAVDADLSQLPPVLKRVVDDASFQKELTQFGQVKGRASGKLTLGDKRSAIDTRIDVSGFDLSFGYTRIPFPLTLKGGRLALEKNRIEIGEVTCTAKSTRLSQITGSVSWGKAPSIDLRIGASRLAVGEIFPRLSELNGFPGSLSYADGTFTVSRARVRGNLLQVKKWEYEAEGAFEALRMEMEPIPGKIAIDQGRFTLNRTEIRFDDVRAKLLDATLRAGGKVDGYLTGPAGLELDFGGAVGDKTIRWASSLVHLPGKIRPRAPLWISSARLTLSPDRAASFTGTLTVDGGPGIDLAVYGRKDEVHLKHLRIQDESSQATLHALFGVNVCDISFAGKMDKTSLDRVLLENPIRIDRVAGDFHMRLNLRDPVESTARGTLAGENLVLTSLPGPPVRFDRLDLEAEGKRLRVKSAYINWLGLDAAISGSVRVGAEGIFLDLDARTGAVTWEGITAFVSVKNDYRRKNGNRESGFPPILGTIRFASESFTIGNFQWRPVRANLTLGPGDAIVTVLLADLCGVSTPGILTVSAKGIHIDFNTLAKDRPLNPTLACIRKGAWMADGVFDLTGTVKSRPRGNDVFRSLAGEWESTARGGRIYRANALTKIFELLNVAEILNTKLPDLQNKAFEYKKITARWKLQDGMLSVQNGLLDSSAMEIGFQGTIDISTDQMDLLVIVAPLQTLNLIVKQIPIFRDIMEGTFISIPFRVRGALGNPAVIPMPVTDVGSEVLDLMKRTLNVPIKIVQPLLPKNGQGRVK